MGGRETHCFLSPQGGALIPSLFPPFISFQRLTRADRNSRLQFPVSKSRKPLRSRMETSSVWFQMENRRTEHDAGWWHLSVSHIHSLFAELVCSWLEGPECVWKKAGRSQPAPGGNTVRTSDTQKIRSVEKSSARSNMDFCRIRKFQNINLDSLVALVKPQTPQILKVSGELDEWANFKQENKNPWDLF